jgi:undecaprenyl-diphosphatase
MGRQVPFLLFMPAVIGAFILEFGHAETQSLAAVPILLGTVDPSVAGYVALRLLLRVVRGGRFHLFAPYCWLAGLFRHYRERVVLSRPGLAPRNH